MELTWADARERAIPNSRTNWTLRVTRVPWRVQMFSEMQDARSFVPSCVRSFVEITSRLLCFRAHHLRNAAPPKPSRCHGSALLL